MNADAPTGSSWFLSLEFWYRFLPSWFLVRKLAENCCKYGVENQDTGSALARAALQFGNSHSSMEDERETLLEILGDQVILGLYLTIWCCFLYCLIYVTSLGFKPTKDNDQRSSFGGCSSLDSAIRQTSAGGGSTGTLCAKFQYRALKVHSYWWMFLLLYQAADVMRRRSKSRDSTPSADSVMRLKVAEGRLAELKSAMMALGREATDAMLSVEDQQQKVTFQHLFKMVSSLR